MKNLITVAQYPKSEIPERYIRIRISIENYFSKSYLLSIASSIE